MENKELNRIPPFLLLFKGPPLSGGGFQGLVCIPVINLAVPPPNAGCESQLSQHGTCPSIGPSLQAEWKEAAHK